MAIKYYSGQHALGTSAERIAATWTGSPTGYRFFETDTGLEYYWNGTAWSKAGGNVLADDADFIVYIDANDSNKVKAIDGVNGSVQFTHATDLGNVLSSIHGSLSSTSGGTVKIKSGAYAWATQLAVTKKFVQINCSNGTIISPTAAFATDVILVDNEGFQWDNGLIDGSAMAGGVGDIFKIGTVGPQSDRPYITNMRILNPRNNAINVGSHTNELHCINNTIQVSTSSAGNGILLSSSADHMIAFNGIGGFANATQGQCIILSGAAQVMIMSNEIYTSRIGISLYLADSVQIVGNLIQVMNHHGILIKNDTATQHRRLGIIGNRIHNSGGSASNTYDGINFTLSSTGGYDNVTIVGNEIMDYSGTKLQRYGININSALLTDSVISSNTVTDNLTGGINVGTHDPTLIVANNPGQNIDYGVRVPVTFKGGRTTAAATTVYGVLDAADTGTSAWSTTESVKQLPLNFAFEPTLLTVRIGSNTFNGNVIVSFRDDAADVTGATVTVTTSDTSGTKASSAITGTVAAGSMVNWKVDSTAASTGTALLYFILEGYMYK